MKYDDLPTVELMSGVCEFAETKQFVSEENILKVLINLYLKSKIKLFSAAIFSIHDLKNTRHCIT